MGRALTVCFALTMVGITSFAVGLWLIWPPLALLFAGVWLMSVAWAVWKDVEKKHAPARKCDEEPAPF